MITGVGKRGRERRRKPEVDIFLDANTTQKLRGFSPQANYTERLPLVSEVSANFIG
jgi:hypothetical protein